MAPGCRALHFKYTLIGSRPDPVERDLDGHLQPGQVRWRRNGLDPGRCLYVRRHRTPDQGHRPAVEPVDRVHLQLVRSPHLGEARGTNAVPVELRDRRPAREARHGQARPPSRRSCRWDRHIDAVRVRRTAVRRGAAGPDGQLPSPGGTRRRHRPRGFAIFGPDHPVSGTPSADDWQYADLQYTDASGYTVNTAKYGAGDWQYTSTDYNELGNVTRGLDERALRKVIDNAVPAGASADQLASVNVYNADIKNAAGDAVVTPAGTLVTDAYGPSRYATVKDGSTKWVRTHTHTDFDELAPNSGINPATGLPYRLATTVTTGTFDPGTGTEEPLTRSTTDYDPAVSGDPSGWALGQPSKTTRRRQPGRAPQRRDRRRGHGHPLRRRRPRHRQPAARVQRRRRRYHQDHLLHRGPQLSRTRMWFEAAMGRTDLQGLPGRRSVERSDSADNYEQQLQLPAGSEDGHRNLRHSHANQHDDLSTRRSHHQHKDHRHRPGGFDPEHGQVHDLRRRHRPGNGGHRDRCRQHNDDGHHWARRLGTPDQLPTTGRRNHHHRLRREWPGCHRHRFQRQHSLHL